MLAIAEVVTDQTEATSGNFLKDGSNESGAAAPDCFTEDTGLSGNWVITELVQPEFGSYEIDWAGQMKTFGSAFQFACSKRMVNGKKATRVERQSRMNFIFVPDKSRADLRDVNHRGESLKLWLFAILRHRIENSVAQ